VATAYSVLYPHIRIIVGDTDASFYRWADGILDDAIEMALLLNADYSASGSGSITPTVASDDDLALIVFESVKVLLNPSPGRFSYKTRVMSVSRDSAGKKDILTFVEDEIYKLRNGGSVVSKDSSLIAYLERGVRYLDTVGEANISG
jgi:hypothetical protein